VSFNQPQAVNDAAQQVVETERTGKPMQPYVVYPESMVKQTIGKGNNPGSNTRANRFYSLVPNRFTPCYAFRWLTLHPLEQYALVVTC
jgi:hypothetical protein